MHSKHERKRAKLLLSSSEVVKSLCLSSHVKFTRIKRVTYTREVLVALPLYECVNGIKSFLTTILFELGIELRCFCYLLGNFNLFPDEMSKYVISVENNGNKSLAHQQALGCSSWSFLLGAFLIPYFTSVILTGIPMFFLEVSIGQLMSRGGIEAWEIIPLFKGTPKLPLSIVINALLFQVLATQELSFSSVSTAITM